jgi:hypothetical protein
VIVAFDAALWQWDARRGDNWIFVSLPVEASEEIRELTAGPRRGFGSVRVRATVGATSWTTSIFPSTTDDCFVLPVKRAVRQAEKIDVGDIASVVVELVS